MEDPLNLTPEQSACLDQLFSSSSPSQRVINFAIQCSGVDPEDVSDIIKFGPCACMHYDNDMHSLIVKSVAMETAAKHLEIS